MKRFGLGVLGFFVFAGMASADVLPLRNTRLEVRQTPLASFHNGKVEVVDIYENGDVYGKSKVMGHLIALPIFVERLSSSEIEEIDSLIQSATLEAVVAPDPHGVHCMAMSVYSEVFTADNGSMLLQSGAVPCGLVTRRVGAASDKLVQILNEELTKFNELN